MEESKELQLDASATRLLYFDGIGTKESAIGISDRRIPRWALAVTIVFSLTTNVIFFGAAVSVLFLFTLVANEGHAIVAPLVLAVLLLPLLGTILIDWIYSWALTGIRGIREDLLAKADGFVSFLGALLLGSIHPLLPIPAIISVLVAVVGFYTLRQTGFLEKSWDFAPEEAASVLAGRDSIGQDLASTKPTEHTIIISLHRLSLVLAGLLSFALTTWLVAQETLQLGSVATLGLISMWLAHGWIRLLRHQLSPSSPNFAKGTRVLGLTIDDSETDGSALQSGLSVAGLNAVRSDGHEILKEVNLEISPGSIVQVTGGSGDGKSLLLRALSDPFSIEDSLVHGRVLADGVDPWSRGILDDKAPIVRVDPQPTLVDGSALNNLTCFQPTKVQDRASRILTHLAHSVDTTDRLTSERKALNLPLGQQKLLCIARAFLLSPNVYVFDLPETFISKYQLIKVQEFIKAEARRGKIFLIVTEDRALASACDYVLVMQDGKNIDFDKAAALRKRYGSGWKRFVGLRDFDTEDSLKSWLGSQFVREGDEENKRIINRVGLNLLIYLCQNSTEKEKSQVIFECMQKEGEFLLKASDSGEPISIAQLAQAKELSANPTVGEWIPPLVNILRDSEKVTVPDNSVTRSITVHIKTYDPRQLGSK